MERIRLLILNFMRPIMVYIGRMALPFSRPRLTSKAYREALAKMKVGDIILTTSSGEISNLLIPGRYKHAAIVVDDNSVVEAVGYGVLRTDLLSFFLSKDYFVILRARFCSNEEALQAAKFAEELTGTPYDYEFHPANNAFYCSELCYHVYNKSVKGNPFTLRKTLGVETVTAQDFYNADNKWHKVMEY